MTYITLEELHTALNAVDALSLKGAEFEVRCVTDAIRRIRFIGHDAVEVVRCRECSWHKPHDYFRGIVCTNPYFEADYISVDEEFYCANGTTDEVGE